MFMNPAIVTEIKIVTYSAMPPFPRNNIILTLNFISTFSFSPYCIHVLPWEFVDYNSETKSSLYCTQLFVSISDSCLFHILDRTDNDRIGKLS